MAYSSSFFRAKLSFVAYISFCIGITFLSTKASVAQSKSSSEITIKINGQSTEVDPPAKLEKGAVLVPLRGVLEKLNAIVTYNAEKQQITVQQGGRTFLLGINLPTATLNQIEIPLSAAPKTERGRTYVPLRSLAELFGYQVQWQGTSRTVQINSTPSINHVAALNRMGHFGVAINVTNLIAGSSTDALLDAAQKSGASFVKIRFDWAKLEATEGDDFFWIIFDQLVRGASDRGMGVVGVLGGSTQWASIYPNSQDAEQWSSAPPAEKYFPAWDNYVRRVVGRYHKDVHAWQIWEYPASYNFRSGAKDYRTIVRRGAVMASLVDPDAVIFAGEPGGVNLGFLYDLKANGINSATAGIMLHPVSQWQPGVPAEPSAFLLPYSTLRDDKSEMFWADALSFPVLSESSPRKIIFHTTSVELLSRLKSTFTPQAQADYLVKTNTLALAAGIQKTSWGALRDEFSYPKVDPVNPDANSGLLTTDLEPRPSYQAFTTLNKFLGKATYVGALANGPDAVLLVFSDGKQNTAIAWSLDGIKSTLSLQEVTATSPATEAPQFPAPQESKGLTLETTKTSEVLDVTGKVISSNNKVALSDSPVWITNLDSTFMKQLQSMSHKPLTSLAYKSNIDFEKGVRADFSKNTQTEEGIYWKKYIHFRGQAQLETINNVSGLVTTVSRDIYNPAAGNPTIYLDVDDAYLYNEPGVAVKVTVEIYKPAVTGTDPFRAKGGFNIQYDSPEGFLFTPWQEVEQGHGIVTYTIDVPRAAFTNRNGYDLVINTWGSKQDLIFKSIQVQRVAKAKSAPITTTSEILPATDPVIAP